MTNAQRSAVASAVRASRGYCLDAGSVIARWCAENPHVPPAQVARVAASFSVPFPSIRGRVEGPFPVFPERPYYDARFHDGVDEVPTTYDACGHRRSV